MHSSQSMQFLLSNSHNTVNFFCVIYKSHLKYGNMRLDTLLIYEQSCEYHTEIAAVTFDNEDISMSLVDLFYATSKHERGIKRELIFLDELEDSIKEGKVECYPIYVKDHQLALNWLDAASNSSTTFSIPYWDFLLPSSIVDYVDMDDENFNLPETWKNIFCSKFILLFLRTCFYSGNLIITSGDIINNNNANKDTMVCSDGRILNKSKFEIIQKNKIEHLLWHKNSNRCTPTDIVHIMQHLLVITLSN